MRVKCFPPVINEQSEILILGTAPGTKSIKDQGYYAHKGNRFWPLMGVILNERIPADYESKKNLLLKHKIALWDVLAECDRTGSGDSSICNEIANDFNLLLHNFPGIKKIVFSGLNPKFFFDTHVKLSKQLPTVVARSTSPTNNRNYSFEELVEIWKPLIAEG